jgi:hypothetical protein
MYSVTDGRHPPHQRAVLAIAAHRSPMIAHTPVSPADNKPSLA